MIGPVISARQRQRIEDLVAAGIGAGAQVVAGGKRPPGLDRGYFIEPTVLRIEDNANPVAQQEVFGPVVTVQGYRDIDEAVAIANDSEYGWAAASTPPTCQPDGCRASHPQRHSTSQPLGRLGLHPDRRFKQSGIGRERGVAGLREYQEIKHLVVGP